jgi:trimeric autotransporter adhesin
MDTWRRTLCLITTLVCLVNGTASWGQQTYNPTASDNSRNTAGGTGALLSNSGGRNTGFGFNALGSNTTGYFNTATGDEALGSNTTGSNNTALGYTALLAGTGSRNTALGWGAGSHCCKGH